MPKAAKSKKPAAPKKGVKKAKSFSTKDEKIEIKENVVEDELAEDNTIPPITTPGPIENYLLYIELLDIDDPCITRTLSVPSWYSFADLSEVIQTAFDWSNMHMHKFEIDLRNEELKRSERKVLSLRPTSYLDDIEEDEKTKDESQIRLCQVFGNIEAPVRLVSITYTYDFGDGWDHDIVFLGKADPGMHRAFNFPPDMDVMCLSGEDDLDECLGV